MLFRNASIALLGISLICCSSTPERAPVLSNTSAFPKDHQVAAQAVAASLQQGGDNPGEFHAVVEGPQSGALIFHLWHQSAFRPENRGISGNPGGKCRDVKFDLATNQVSQAVLWQ